jgi:hypothetical protein
LEKSLAKVIEITTQSKPPQAKAKAALPPETVSVEITRGSAEKIQSSQAILSQRKYNTSTVKKRSETPGKHSRGSGSGIISTAQRIQRITDNIFY